MIDRSSVKRHFSRAASRYDAAAVLQQEVAHRLAERLPLIKLTPQRILDLGAGTGFVSQHLTELYPQAQLLAIDLSAAMLVQYREKRLSTPWWQRLNPFAKAPDIHLINGDAYHIPLADGSCDMLISSLMLQWCDDLPAVLREARRVLRTDGVLFIASLGPDTLIEIRNAWQQVDGLAEQHMLNFADIHLVGDALSQSGFADPVCDVERITLTYAQPIDAINDLKNIGATNANKGRSTGLMGKKRWTNFLAAYQAQALSDGRIPATFEVVYAHAFAAQLRHGGSVDAHTASIPVSAIKQWVGK